MFETRRFVRIILRVITSAEATTMRIACVISVLVLCVAVVIGEPCQRNGVRCLDYEVIQTHEGYEERRYPSLVWVSTSENAKTKSDVSRKLIKKLYAYLGGDNSKGERIDMVVPVRTTKMPQGAFNRYIMAIPLKPEQSANAPQPTDPHISLITEPMKTYVVRSFGGQVRQEAVWDDHARNLQASVSNDVKVNSTFYYMCVYDSPWRETNRLNEVWMLKKT